MRSSKRFSLGFSFRKNNRTDVKTWMLFQVLAGMGFVVVIGGAVYEHLVGRVTGYKQTPNGTSIRQAMVRT